MIGEAKQNALIVLKNNPSVSVMKDNDTIVNFRVNTPMTSFFSANTMKEKWA
jgi:hypothetical protein